MLSLAGPALWPLEEGDRLIQVLHLLILLLPRWSKEGTPEAQVYTTGCFLDFDRASLPPVKSPLLRVLEL